jgi:hypothetical protein
VARRRRAERFYACGALEQFRAARSTRTLGVSEMTLSERNRLAALLLLSLVASLLHFVHNAEFLSAYPNLPTWLTRPQVYFAWAGLATLGVCGLVLYLRGWHSWGLLLIGLYAAFGFDGLLHYSRAPFAEHTVAMNFTIWFEVVAAALLLVTVVFAALKRLHRYGTDA